MKNDTTPYTATGWYDEQSISQWEHELRYFYDYLQQYPGRTTQTPTMLIYAWNEMNEGGAGLEPNSQFASPISMPSMKS